MFLSRFALFKNNIIKNSFWGILAQFSQSLLLSLFFVIIARNYATKEFATYAVVNVLYQLVLAFSALGLNQWFIREFANSENKQELLNKFFKIQFFLGIFFYAINVLSAIIIYNDKYIFLLSAVVGINIVFDNLINAVKCVNIAMGEQRRTFSILTLESLLKFAVSCLLFVFPFSIMVLSVSLLLVRFLSLNLFLSMGASKSISLKKFYRYRIDWKDAFSVILPNWPFIIIGAVSMVNWRISTIIISKVLTAFDVANYEISYKLFTIAQILPIIISTSVFPLLIRLYHERDTEAFKSLYKNVSFYYTLIGLCSYLFIYSFADDIIQFAFGQKYLANAYFTRQTFLTMLIFPTAFLQANMLVAMKLEKKDMIFNIVLLIVNVSLCSIGLMFTKSLSMINYAIFIGFVVFHLCQDVALLKYKITSIKQIVEFYLLLAVVVVSYVTLSNYVNRFLLFSVYCIVGLLAVLYRNKLYTPPFTLTMGRFSKK